MIGEIAAGATLAASAAALGAWIWSKYQHTFGRAHLLERKVVRVAAGMQIEYLDELLGVPPYRDLYGEHRVSVWVEPEYFLQAVTDAAGRAVMLSVATRMKRFAPTFFRGRVITSDGDTLEVRLGRTKFAELPFGPSAVQGGVGARRFNYDEGYYFGNPGHYQYFIYSLNQAAWQRPDDFQQFMAAGLSNGDGLRVGTFDGSLNLDQSAMAAWLDDPRVSEARRSVAINCITMTAPGTVPLANMFVWGFGPDWDQLRVGELPSGPADLIKTRWRVWRARRRLKT